MSHFDSLAPAWNDISPPEVIGEAKLTDAGIVSITTSDGPLHISLHRFGARLKFGDCQFGDYGMLLNEPEVEGITLDVGGSCTTIVGAGHTLKVHHLPLSLELFKGSPGSPEITH